MFLLLPRRGFFFCLIFIFLRPRFVSPSTHARRRRRRPAFTQPLWPTITSAGYGVENDFVGPKYSTDSPSSGAHFKWFSHAPRPKFSTGEDPYNAAESDPCWRTLLVLFPPPHRHSPLKWSARNHGVEHSIMKRNDLREFNYEILYTSIV